MFRQALAVIVGYAVLIAIVTAGFAPAFFQRELAMKPGSLDVKSGWIIYTLVLSCIAAVVGGWICAVVARSQRGVVVFAALAFVLGLAMAIQNYYKPMPTQTAEQVAKMSLNEIGEIARQPDWYAFTLPFVAAGGILFGGRRGQGGP